MSAHTQCHLHLWEGSWGWTVGVPAVMCGQLSEGSRALPKSELNGEKEVKHWIHFLFPHLQTQMYTCLRSNATCHYYCCLVSTYSCITREHGRC